MRGRVIRMGVRPVCRASMPDDLESIPENRLANSEGDALATAPTPATPPPTVGKPLASFGAVSHVLLKPCFLHSSLIGSPASASRRKPMICSSLHRFFIGPISISG